jgi:MFS superfamily sulfate permease-like transporter
MNDAAGGHTQSGIDRLIAAAVIAAVLMFFTGPLQYVPSAAQSAVLLKAALSLTDLKTRKMLYRIDRREFVLTLLAIVAARGSFLLPPGTRPNGRRGLAPDRDWAPTKSSDSPHT